MTSEELARVTSSRSGCAGGPDEVGSAYCRPPDATCTYCFDLSMVQQFERGVVEQCAKNAEGEKDPKQDTCWNLACESVATKIREMKP